MALPLSVKPFLSMNINIPSESKVVAISLDDVMVPTRCDRIIASDSRYEEASCATITFYDATGKCLWKKQTEISHFSRLKSSVSGLHPKSRVKPIA